MTNRFHVSKVRFQRNTERFNNNQADCAFYQICSKKNAVNYLKGLSAEITKRVRSEIILVSINNSKIVFQIVDVSKIKLLGDL